MMCVTYCRSLFNFCLATQQSHVTKYPLRNAQTHMSSTGLLFHYAIFIPTNMKRPPLHPEPFTG